MSIKKLKSPRGGPSLFQIRITYTDKTTGKRRNLRRNFSGSFAEAKLLEAEMVDLRDRGELGHWVAEAKAMEWDDTTSGMTVKELATEWLAKYAFKSMKPSSFQSAECHLRLHVLDRIGKRPLARLKARDFADLLDEVAERRSANTANNVRSTLQSMMGYAVRREYITSNPINRQSVPAQKVRRTGRFENFLTPEEARGFLAAILQHGTHKKRFPLYLFLLETGVRFGEAAALRLADLDLGKQRAYIYRGVRQGVDTSTKGEDERVVTFSDTLTEALRDHIKLMMSRRWPGNPIGLVFPNRVGTYLTPKSLAWSMKAGLEGSNNPKAVTIHGLRHSFCTALALEGRSALEIAERAGHAQATTTERYIHLAESIRRETPAIIKTFSAGLYRSGDKG